MIRLAAPAPDFNLGKLKPKFFVAQIFNAHMDDAVVGLMDPAHVPFVHNQWWWRPPSTGLRLKEKPFEPAERGWALARHKPSGNSLAYKMLMGSDSHDRDRLPDPRLPVGDHRGEAGPHFHADLPDPDHAEADAHHADHLLANAPLLDFALPILIPAATKFLGQDGHMVNLQNQGLAYQQNMLWIDDIDVQAKWYRTLKKEWAAARSEGSPLREPDRATHPALA